MPFDTYRELKEKKKFRWWHDAIIDSMLADPFMETKDRAAKLGYSVNYLSAIMNSDMFKAAYAARREHYNAMLQDSIGQKAGLLANAGLDIMLEQMTKTKRDKLPFAQVAETTLSVLEKLGYGAKPSAAQVNVQVNNNGQQVVAVPVSAEALASAREKLRGVEQQRALEAPHEGPSAVPLSPPPLEGEVLEPEGKPEESSGA